MRNLFVTATTILLLAAPAHAKLVSAGPGVSWGKAGVSLDQYRSDSIACGRQAANYDLTGSDPARALAVASKIIDNQANAGPPAVQDATQPPGAAMDALGMAGATPSAVQMVGPDRQIAKAGDLIKTALDNCLAGRGYREFRLTGEQKRKLSKLPVGSDARHAYLHSLASNPTVLENQAIQ
ncbi:MAG: hypothetical protein JWP15_2260 [Alphaproteobacteria bacterium]|nr:hypothetical protein [Alphaproteobacteria bacterium]